MATDQNTEKGTEKGAKQDAKSVQGSTSRAAADENDANILWVISNRQDDRVVLFERDPRHPGGEAFVGGGAPDKVYRTAEVERLLHTGEIIEIPEPPDGPKKPVEVAPVISQTPAAMPGQPIKLGRKLDPEVVPEGAQKGVQARQRQAPREIASKATVPPPRIDNKETQTS
jgi:hypothetical protein